MERLTDLNPYDVLEIRPNADRQTIKRALANKQRENKTQGERQQALKARNLLASVESRLIVDCLTPDFTGEISEDGLIRELGQSSITPTNWLDLIDEQRILNEDLQAHLEATIRYTLRDIPLPSREPQLLTNFDGLDHFLDGWLK